MTNNIIGSISFYDMTMLFFIYGFLGWAVEVIFATLKTGKFVNRGFLSGPICPIYGIGMSVLVLLLNTLTESWWLLFLAGGALATLLELVTGFVLEKIFKTKWWDYSKEPFNFKGYVCLRFSILWGVGVLTVFQTLVPLSLKIIEAIPVHPYGIIVLSVLFSVLLVDCITDVVQLKRLKYNINEVSKAAAFIKKGSDGIGVKISDATVATKEAVLNIAKKIKKSRLGKAFPSVGKKPDDIITMLEEAERLTEKKDDKPE